MARETAMIVAAERIAELIHEYARKNDWPENQYHIFMTANTSWDILRILVASTSFDDRTETQEFSDYDDLMDFIEANYPRKTRDIRSFSLVLSGMNGFTLYLSPRLEPDEIEIDEKRINRGVSWTEAGSR